jgi:SAM-dependent methyltransferase
MALELKPDFSDAYVNLGDVLLDHGDVAQALDVVRRGLDAGGTSEIKGLFTRCIRRAGKGGPMLDVDALGENLVRALTEPWGRPSDLAAFACTAVKQAPVIGDCVRRANEAWPRQLSESVLPAEWPTVGSSRLLMALLESTAVCDIELERFLTTARSALLKRAAATADQDATDDLLLCCALARQCFINDYVFIASEDELAQSSRLSETLTERLRSGATVPAIWLAALATYAPLNALPDAASILDRSWPDALNDVLTQQIREPAEEQKARASIDRLTPIADHVSRLVQEQYEENPYPRWVRTAVMAKATTVDIYLRRHLPYARFQALGKTDRVAILIAGCGTGQHSIETARRYLGVDMLAVDLSATSLSYAQRKSRELGLEHVRYAQADILQLGSIDRSFDLIEAGGVLHHLADPLAGWRVLLSILRPAGIMRVGLYSEIARSQIIAAQKFIAERGYGRTAQDIRQFRQDLFQAEPKLGLRIASECRDFFSTSECRDLLFHHQEHRFSLSQIADFLAEAGLSFLGFDVEGRIVQQFRQRFPDTAALTDLTRWDLFERENPQTFSGMYQFYLQKP